ncbi:MAG: SH3 domain-containing protein [Candidatus Zixiibacteriota bacterium]
MRYFHFLLFFIIGFAFGATGMVTSDVFMYKGIGDDTDVINIIPEGSYVKMLFAKDEWAYVKYQNTKGNVKRENIEVIETQTLQVKSDKDVRLYGKPMTESETINILKYGDAIDVIETRDEFLKVQSDGFSGWIIAKNIRPPEETLLPKDKLILPENETAETQDTKEFFLPDSMKTDMKIQANYDTTMLDIVDAEQPKPDIDLTMPPTEAYADIEDQSDEDLPYEYYRVQRDYDQQDAPRTSDDSNLEITLPDDDFDSGQAPDRTRNESYSEQDGYQEYPDGIKVKSVDTGNSNPASYTDYSYSGQVGSNMHYVPRTGENEPEIYTERPVYSRAYSKYRTHIGFKVLAGTIVSVSNDWGGDDFQDDALFYGVQTGTRIARTASGRFGSVLRAAFYFSYNGYMEDEMPIEYNVNEFYYIIPVSFGLSYDLSNDIAITSGIGVSAVHHQKEYSLSSDDDWDNMIDKTYLSPNAYVEFSLELTPFIISIGGEYLQWNSDNTEFEVDVIGNETPLHGELERHLFGGYGSIRLGF